MLHRAFLFALIIGGVPSLARRLRQDDVGVAVDGDHSEETLVEREDRSGTRTPRARCVRP